MEELMGIATNNGTSKANYNHPKTVFFHLFFRTLAVLSYLFCRLWSDSFVMDFVVIILLLSCDFWTVKNVSGRLLVGLRWWNKVSDDGSTEWVFESKTGQVVHTGESRVFWWSLYGFTLIWGVFGFTAIISLKFGYLMLVGVALSFNISNVVGYWYCRKDSKKKLSAAASDLASTYVPGLLAQAATSGLLSNVGTFFSDNKATNGEANSGNETV
eukprot:m.153066 g.153066  ORF g.153066 m.153066 type:complete len:214 (-) comp30826_c1_seq1:124-765(-)